MISFVRLIGRQYRFQIVAVLIASLGVAGAATWLAVQLDTLAVVPGCLEGTATGAEETCENVARFRELGGFNVVKMMGWIGFLPFVVGVVLGAPLVAREIEHGSAVLAWSLGRDRRRWLLERVILLGAVVLVVLAAPMVAASLLGGADQPGIDPRASFEYYGMHGPLLLLRGLATFSIGTLLGAVLGRTLPALIAAAAASVLIFFGLGVLEEHWVAGTLSPAGAVRTVDSDTSFYIETLYRDASGALLTRDEVENLAPMEPLSLEYGNWLQATFEPLSLTIPGSRFPDVEVRESVALAGMSVVAIGVAGAVVQRRRPT
ncbi:MAG: hypothetical protein ACRDGH_03230 [Candidatus Limnocylindria bacterium]